MDSADDALHSNVTCLINARDTCAALRAKVETIQQTIHDASAAALVPANIALKKAMDALIEAQKFVAEKHSEVTKIQADYAGSFDLPGVLLELEKAEEARKVAETAFKETPWCSNGSKVVVKINELTLVVEKVTRAGRLNWSVGKLKASLDGATYAKIEIACRTPPSVEIVLSGSETKKRGRNDIYAE